MEDPLDVVVRLSAALVDGSSEAVALVVEGRVRIASAVLAALFGYASREELIGLAATSLVVAGDADALTAALASRVASARPMVGRRRDGAEMPVDVSVRSVGPAHLVRARDLSPVPENALYRALFEVNSAVKLLIDPSDARIVDANMAAAELYGWSLDELRTMRITDLNTLDPEVVREELGRARTVSRGFFRFEHRTARGELRHVEVHASPVTLEGRDLILSIVHDVTERDAFEEQLRRAQRLETVGRLAGGVAHDFNNLLTIMTGSCGLIARHVPAGSPAWPHLDDLTHTIRRAAGLTRQLLTLGSRQVMLKRTLDLPGLIRSMARLVRQTLESRIALSLALDPAPPVYSDPGQLEQVILNLVLNARDAMPEGGTLTLATSSRVVGPDEAPGLSPGEYAALTVTDTGEGMDEATRAQIFDPFFSTRTSTGGTGLGLSMVYGIVTQSEGHVEVRSEPGRGSTFTVLLPASSDPLSVDDHDAIGGGAGADVVDGPRVALVEDVDDLRRVLAQALEELGFRVDAFASGDEALAWAEGGLETLDAVVSDVVMPGISGIALAQALRERRPRLPIVLVSGDLREHVRATLPPDVLFLQKPFSIDELARLLRAALA